MGRGSESEGWMKSRPDREGRMGNRSQAGMLGNHCEAGRMSSRSESGRVCNRSGAGSRFVLAGIRGFELVIGG